MNITAREATFGSWNRRRLQIVLVVSVAALAVAVAVGFAASGSDPDGSALVQTETRAPAPVVRYQPPATTYFLVDSAEDLLLVNTAQNEIAEAAAVEGSSVQADFVVIDVSTPEGQEQVNAIHAGLAEVWYESGYAPRIEFVNWAD